MKLPQPRKIIAEKYVAGLSLFKSRRSPIKLSANESALGPSPKAVKSYSSVGKGFVRYPDSDGTYFRKVLAKKFKLKRDRIILGSGSDQIFELICKLFLNKGDEVVVPEYSFIIYRIYSRMFGAKVRYAKEENFAASDPLALSQLTSEFVFLEDGDIAEITKESYQVFDENNSPVTRDVTQIDIAVNAVTKGEYSHFMEKEIYEQPTALANTIDGKLGDDDVLDNIFGLGSSEVFSKIKRIQFVACGTSLHAGKVGRFWFEHIAQIPCYVDFASEYRYRDPLVEKGTLFVTISQSGETADTLAALRYAQEKDYLSTLSICNVPTSSLARESEHVLFTNAGPEIGVASTKAFTTQLAGLMLLAMSIAKSLNKDKEQRKNLAYELRNLPKVIEETLKLSNEILNIVPNIADKHNALFLGRGMFFPIVQEGALKLKEISYIHAEAYPAGELKHGPLALVDDQIPVVALSPENTLTEKLVSNLEEVKARGGTLYVFGGENAKIKIERGEYIQMPECSELLAPIIYTIPLQILAYQVACQRGTDLDQPRNLAKSVTVE